MLENIRPRWERWRAELPVLEKLKVPRCHKPNEFGEIKKVELHYFSDTSQNGYGQCSYLRLTDYNKRIHCSLVMGKSRVTPLKPVTIPRLKLTAAVVASKIGCVLRKELKYEEVKETYWTDGKTVLGYIINDARRIDIFVGNRVQEIRDKTSPEQWHYIGTTENPADVASCGSSLQELISNHLWWNGPDLLWKPSKGWNLTNVTTEISPEDPQVRRVSTLATHVQEPLSFLERLEYFSSWHSVKKAVAVRLRLHEKFRSPNSYDEKVKRDPNNSTPSKYIPANVEELQNAENKIIKTVQRAACPEEIHRLKESNVRGQTSGERTPHTKTRL